MAGLDGRTPEVCQGEGCSQPLPLPSMLLCPAKTNTFTPPPAAAAGAAGWSSAASEIQKRRMQSRTLSRVCTPRPQSPPVGRVLDCLFECAWMFTVASGCIRQNGASLKSGCRSLYLAPGLARFRCTATGESARKAPQVLAGLHVWSGRNSPKQPDGVARPWALHFKVATLRCGA